MRELPEDDLGDIFGVVVVVNGLLMSGQLDEDLAAKLRTRLGRDSDGELSAHLDDLAQRMHWAMGAYETYPAARPREVIYRVKYASRPDREFAGSRVTRTGDEVEVAYPDPLPDEAIGQQLAEWFGGQYVGCSVPGPTTSEATGTANGEATGTANGEATGHGERRRT